MDEIIDRLDRIEAALALLTLQRQVQEWYDTATAAKELEKDQYTIREWCREGRCNASKRPCGRGTSKEVDHQSGGDHSTEDGRSSAPKTTSIAA